MIETMDVDEASLNNISVWFFPGLTKTIGRIQLRQLDFNVVTVDGLKNLIAIEDKRRAANAEDIQEPHFGDVDIDLIYNGNLLKDGGTTLAGSTIKPDGIIHVVKKVNTNNGMSGSTSTRKTEITPDHIREVAMALRTAFLSPTFLKTIEKLTESEMLHNIFAIAPGLETDLTGIAIIQNPQMIFQLSEREALTRLANERPWVLEALNHIAAAVHADKASKPSRVPANLMLSQLLNTAFDGAEEDEDMEGEEDAEPPRTQSQPNLHGPITREQLSQALNAVPAFTAGGRGTLSPGGLFANLLGTAGTSRPTTAPPSTITPSTGQTTNFQQILENALSSISQNTNQNSSGESPIAQPLSNLVSNPTSSAPSTQTQDGTGGAPVITGELVARAMQEAFSQLPPAERERHYNIFRQLAQQVAAGNPPASVNNVPGLSPAPSVSPSAGFAPAGGEYQQQLAQMRELGITDERLSILALRVSDGDVETATELIFSGWDGSGADASEAFYMMAEMVDEADFSVFENKTGLAEDMKFLASMPELCDVTFLVGDTREPVCAVKAVLAARSRVFHKMFYQVASPQKKKEEKSPKEGKLRLFLKRSSEPLLNMPSPPPSQRPPPQQHQTLIIEEFEPDVFRQLIEYIHTGYVTLQPRTLLGVMNAADYYGLDELRKACVGFVTCCINVDTVCALLASAERYIQYKCTKSLVQKVLEFVDLHGTEVLNLGSFTLLPQHVVRLVLVREELKADEFTKFQAALMWAKKYCDNNRDTPVKEVMGNFLEYIQFHKIPANVLMKDIHPLGVVPYHIVMNALAYQADPTSIDLQKLSPNRARRSTGGRSMSVQSSLDPYGSTTTLASSGSSELDGSGRVSSGGGENSSPQGQSSG